MKVKPSELSKAIRKSPSNKLWDKLLKNWNEKDFKEFNDILNSDGKKTILIYKTKRIAKNAIKVMRMSDNKIYNSIEECKYYNDLHDVEMRAKIKIGTEFKKL